MFFVIHFLLPFILLGVVGYHVVALHISGSTSLIFTHRSGDSVSFFRYFWFKDGLNIIIFLVFFEYCLLYPYRLGEVDIFVEVNSLISPAHIAPEWYFLFAYAILRALPNKSAGVIIILLSVAVLLIYPLIVGYGSIHNMWVV